MLARLAVDRQSKNTSFEGLRRVAALWLNAGPLVSAPGSLLFSFTPGGELRNGINPETVAPALEFFEP